MRDHYGIDVPSDAIAVTTGSSAAFNLAFLAMFDPGDRVAIAAPGYPAYRNIMAALGLEVVEIELDGAAYLHGRPSAPRARRETPLKGVLFASPANPTGAVIPPKRTARSCSRPRGNWASPSSPTRSITGLSYGAPDETALEPRSGRARSSIPSRNTIA